MELSWWSGTPLQSLMMLIASGYTISIARQPRSTCALWPGRLELSDRNGGDSCHGDTGVTVLQLRLLLSALSPGCYPVARCCRRCSHTPTALLMTRSRLHYRFLRTI